MRIKCRGYEGNLIDLDAIENTLRNGLTGEIAKLISWYNIAIRSDDGARIELDRVQESEIEVING